jgi:Asp-tRNA(Asn)/Glu-tRNA(Gln) amidotransferase A subunit family amidase
MSDDLAYFGLAEAAELIRDKKLSPVEYATALLARIERHDPKLNAFITLMPEQAGLFAVLRGAHAFDRCTLSQTRRRVRGSGPSSRPTGGRRIRTLGPR